MQVVHIAVALVDGTEQVGQVRTGFGVVLDDVGACQFEADLDLAVLETLVGFRDGQLRQAVQIGDVGLGFRRGRDQYPERGHR